MSGAQVGTPSASAAADTEMEPAGSPAVGGGAASAANSSKAKKPGTVSSGPAVPAAKRIRKKKKPAKLMPSKVAALIPESAYYTQLLDMERRVDQVVARRKLEIEAALKQPEIVKQKLRIYIYNLHENQGSENPADVPGWTLVIYGRLVAGPLHGANTEYKMNTSFSGLLKSLEVRLDPEQFEGQAGRVSWTAANHTGLHSDAFEIKRQGSKACKATIRLQLGCGPEKHQLSEALAAVVGTAQETRARVVKAVWAYIKSKDLQSPSNPLMVDCDAKLQDLFKEPQVKLSSIVQRLGCHFGPVPVIQLEYTIATGVSSPTHPDCYEIDVEVPASQPAKLVDFLNKYSKDREIDVCNSRIAAGIEKINEHRRRRAFVLGFSHSPVDFINSLVVSQGYDLRSAAGAGTANVEALRRTELFQGKWVEDAVYRYLQRRSASQP